MANNYPLRLVYASVHEGFYGQFRRSSAVSLGTSFAYRMSRHSALCSALRLVRNEPCFCRCRGRNARFRFALYSEYLGLFGLDLCQLFSILPVMKTSTLENRGVLIRLMLAFLSLTPRMEMLCPPRKKPRCNSTLSLGETKLQRDAKDLINMLPDGCLYEIFRCLPRAQDCSACAAVSKQWLMLQSNMWRSDFKHRSKPSSKISGERPCGGRSVNTAESPDATFLDEETYESSSEAAGEGIDIDGKRP